MYRYLKNFMLIALVFWTGSCNANTANSQKTIVVGHRGASFLAPENTVASTVLAFKKDADISEIDVYLSKDNRIMVIHDKTTKRTAGVDLKVAETDSARLRELEVGTFKSPAYAGEKIPFIEEIIEVIPEGKKLFIEIKCGPEIAPYLKKAIDDSGKEKQMEIIAGNLEAMAACKKLMPSIPQYWVLATQKDKKTGLYLPYSDDVIERSLAMGLTGVDLHYKGLKKEFVEKAHNAGLEVFVWTVNDIEVAKTMCEYGVDGITTDKPGVMRAGLEH